MKTDRELLELAAKAAGMSVGLALGEHEGQSCLFIQGQDKPWNPLTDDGDALRLQISLRIDMSFVGPMVEVCWTDKQARKMRFVEEPIDDSQDAREATRRAIVRAAAAIGEPMQ